MKGKTMARKTGKKMSPIRHEQYIERRRADRERTLARSQDRQRKAYAGSAW